MSLVNIVNGPSKFDLMTALFVWHPERMRVQFVDSCGGRTYSAVINSCGAEDGSGESWNISGYLYPMDQFKALGKGSGKVVLGPFRGCFNTSTRKGVLNLE